MRVVTFRVTTRIFIEMDKTFPPKVTKNPFVNYSGKRHISFPLLRGEMQKNLPNFQDSFANFPESLAKKL